MRTRQPLGIVDRIWITGTLSLICFLVYGAQIFCVWPWYRSRISWDLIKLLGPFNILSGLLLWNYYLCVSTPPGAVPAEWQPPDDPNVPQELKDKTGQRRFCKTCRIHKPPRAHHCRKCGHCVLKMDHHCPWIANCVGFYNQGHFIRFLLYVDFATSYHLVMLARRAYTMTDWTSPPPTNFELALLIVQLCVCVPVSLMVGCFSIYHLYCTGSNSTTIEGWEKDRVATMIRRGTIREVKYPYNVGLVQNFRAVLGPNALLWLWPQKMQGTGLSYPVSMKLDAFEQFTWPPQDPSRCPPPKTLPYSRDSGNRSAFTFGSEQLNPNLVPSSAARRRAGKQSPAANDQSTDAPEFPEEYHPGPLPPSISGRPPKPEADGHDGYSSGEDRRREDKMVDSDWEDDDDDGLAGETDSPQQYLSDYDDSNDGHLDQSSLQNSADDDEEFGPAAARRVRVRRGSEGYEIAPVRRWDAELMILESSQPRTGDESTYSAQHIEFDEL